ncbi:hypothetical protein MP638_000311 [Amoeboaphelidium occidentale]|nr:hypothetical protein MP638_000311 [Amoeboaphelidium occidentale]
MFSSAFRKFSTRNLSAAGAKKVLDNYAGKISHKASKEGVSVNELIKRNVPRDEVGKVRQVNNQVYSWRAKHNRSSGASVFVSVPWLNKDKADSKAGTDTATNGQTKSDTPGKQ